MSRTAWARWAGSAVLVGLLASCSVLPTVPQDLQTIAKTQAPIELKTVPFFAQEEFFCGPSTLAMVLNHAGENTNPEKLAELVYLPGRQGSLQLEMLAAPRRLGYLSYQIEPKLPALFDALNAGAPVVVLLNLALPMTPQWHYAVVIGYEPVSDSMILRSGPKERELIPLATFLKLWERSENWAFTVIKTTVEPPRYVNAQGYLNSTVALERSSTEKAGQAYQQGAKTWPNEPWFHFGLGNQAYGAKNYIEAEQHYRK
ncbi:MAG: PA2778 family cysteine peptidase, partial [Limnobacter sp.]